MTDQPFLKNVTDHIIENYKNNIGDICVVLPNRRAGLFLKKHLSSTLQKTFWEPTVYSIEDFVVELSGLKTIDPVFLLFELYEIHKEVEGANAQTFEQFLKWGDVLIHDFNDVDMYLADAKRVFGFLSDAKAIEKWNPDGKALTDFELKYLRFFSSLKEYYLRLNERLLNKKQVYAGLAFRVLSEKIEGKVPNLPWKRVIFAGFNALTKAEDKIIRTLVNSGVADQLWDADNYYLENEVQEAGLFLRRFRNNAQKDDFKWIGDHFANEAKEIEIIGVPQNVGQAKVAGKIIKENGNDDDIISRTAIVLNDESLMLPVLNSIPEEISEFNLTMGLPLTQSPLFSMYEAFFDLHENALKFDKSEGKQIRFYFRDLLKLTQHNYLKPLFLSQKQQNKPVIEDILKSQNKIFYSYNEVLDLLSPIVIEGEEGFISMFEPWGNDPHKALEKLISIIHFLKLRETTKGKNENQRNTDLLKVEYLYHFSKIFKRLENLLKGFPYLDNVRSLHHLFNQIVRSLTISFYGEPLTGLQIMGMLETRTLDFENLIMLSVNEDLIPSGKSSNSFIPFDIRIQYELPTYKDRNAIFAYHFYRLLQRTKKAYLLYNTEAGNLGGGDKSRFISQLLVELPKYNPEIRVVEKVLTGIPGRGENESPIVIPKDDYIFKKIINHAKNGFSPSALNIFRNCSLRYYFQYVAGLYETEDVEETIEAATLGNVVHDVLHKLYIPYINKNITEVDLKKMLSVSEALVGKSFKEHYEGGELDHGKNLLVVKVAGMFVSNFLYREIESLQKSKSELFILSLEKLYSNEITIKHENVIQAYPVKFKGKCDRIDSLNGTIRIIDYKSGMVKSTDLVLKDWDLLEEGIKQDKIFQVLFYAYVCLRGQSKVSQNVKAGIFSFRNLSSGFLSVKTPDGDEIGQDVLNEFEKSLIELTEKLMNRDIPFQKTSNSDQCVYCPFVSICNR